MRTLKEKAKDTAVSLAGCQAVKFKNEPMENLKAWTAFFEEELDALDNELFAPGANHEVIVGNLEKGLLPGYIEEASLCLLHLISH